MQYFCVNLYIPALSEVDIASSRQALYTPHCVVSIPIDGACLLKILPSSCVQCACVQVYYSGKGPPPPAITASVRPEDHSSEVKLYNFGIKWNLTERWNVFQNQKRVVWRGRVKIATSAKRVVWRGRVKIETSAAWAVKHAWCSVVAGLQHSIYLRLLIETFVKCVVYNQIASSEDRIKIPWTTARSTWSINFYYWLYCIYICPPAMSS